MIAEFLKRFTAPDTAPAPDEDARRALGALLVRVAKSDGNYDASEIAVIDQVLAERYGLNPVEAAKLRAECEAIEREAPDTVRFTRSIKDKVGYEDRAAVIEALWRTVLADGIREQHEEQLLRMVAPMLGISDQDSHSIRKGVEAETS